MRSRGIHRRRLGEAGGDLRRMRQHPRHRAEIDGAQQRFAKLLGEGRREIDQQVDVFELAALAVVHRLANRDPSGGDAAGEVARKVIPYAAVIYDSRGNAWTYTSPQPLTFVREQLGIEYIEGGQAVLLDGPPTDTAVVIVGGPELFGTEFGVGH